MGKPLSEPVNAAVVVLADEARNGRLVICAGAGLSFGSGIPGGEALAELLHRRFESVAGYSCDHPEKLLAVADAAASLSDGLAAVQRAVLELAPFSTAHPQEEHELLALLVAEGALRLLLTNWDDCVERSWSTETIRAARNKYEAEKLSGQFILKIHGCCTEPESLLITTAQLRDPEFWTDAYFAAELLRSTTVFLGIGDIASYARVRIEELVAQLERSSVRVVSRNIVDKWETTEWRDVLPNVPVEHGTDVAKDFIDELAREWVCSMLRETVATADPSASARVGAVIGAFQRFDSLEALRWLRTAAVRPQVGVSTVMSPATPSTLEAIGILAESDSAEIRAVQPPNVRRSLKLRLAPWQESCRAVLLRSNRS